jgi:hypothetical protein
MGGTDSLLTFTFPDTGQFMVVATRYDTDTGFSEGNYRLTAIRQGVDGGDKTPADSTVELTIANNSGAELCGIWFSPSSSSDWDQERLSTEVGTTLASGFFITWAVAPDTYDLWVADCFDGYLEQYHIDVLRATEVEVRATHFVIK